MKHFGYKFLEGPLTFDNKKKDIIEVSFNTCDGWDEENDEDNLENRENIMFSRPVTEKEAITAAEKFFNEVADQEYIDKRKPYLFNTIDVDFLPKPILKGYLVKQFMFELERQSEEVIPGDRFRFDKFE